MKVTIGKTTYAVVKTQESVQKGGYVLTGYTLRAILKSGGLAKQEKILSKSTAEDQYFLWSARSGMRGMGMPKPVEVSFSE